MRASLGLTAAELGSLLNVASATVSRWETNKHEVPREVIAVLAALADDRLEGRTTTLTRLRALREPSPASEQRDHGFVALPVV